jgi:hypothetical protein
MDFTGMLQVAEPSPHRASYRDLQAERRQSYAYLKATLEAIAKGHPAARIDELMPWDFDKQA